VIEIIVLGGSLWLLGKLLGGGENSGDSKPHHNENIYDRVHREQPWLDDHVKFLHREARDRMEAKIEAQDRDQRGW
jgi:hypothetical protein